VTVINSTNIYKTSPTLTELIERKKDHDRHDLAWNRYKMWRD